MPNFIALFEPSKQPYVEPGSSVFSVTINGEKYNVLATSSREAINKVMNLIGGECCPPEGLSITIKPCHIGGGS
jgi:hypothetical protein